MPANDVTIEAEFAENPVEAYTLTVIKGTASVAAGTPITDKIEHYGGRTGDRQGL